MSPAKTATGGRFDLKKFTVTKLETTMKIGFALAIALAAAPAFGADATLKSLVAQAKAASGGQVLVMGTRIGDVRGALTDTAGDVFCVAVKREGSEKPVEYCFAYASLIGVAKPGTGAHSDFTPMWVDGGR